MFIRHETHTDAYLFFFEPDKTNASFGEGLSSEEVWTVSSRVIFNPNRRAKYIASVIKGFNQSSGNPTGGTRDYYELHGKAIFSNKHIISAYFKKDAWGPYDFHRQFNAVYPEQFKIDYSYRLGTSGVVGSSVDELNATQIGVRALYRGYDENSIDLDPEFVGDYQWSVLFYLTYKF